MCWYIERFVSDLLEPMERAAKLLSPFSTDSNKPRRGPLRAAATSQEEGHE
jgi:hypothetical protein